MTTEDLVKLLVLTVKKNKQEYTSTEQMAYTLGVLTAVLTECANIDSRCKSHLIAVVRTIQVLNEHE